MLTVIPAQAGIHLGIARMDSRLRGNDRWLLIIDYINSYTEEIHKIGQFE